MFATFVGLLISGYPVAWVLAGTGVIFALGGELLNHHGILVDADLSTLGLVVNRIYGTMSNYGLVPLPLFVFMGHMLDRSGVAGDLLRAMQALMGRLAGGLALAVTLLGVVLAASTGIIGASVALLGTLALPAMLDDGYQPELAVGTVAAAGCLGILIPPSIMLVLMSDPMQLSVGDLFLGAVFPGLLLAGLYLTYLIIRCRLQPELAPPHTGSSGSAALSEVIRALLPPLGLIIAVLGSIFFGIVSPSEAAGVGALGATLLALARRRLDRRIVRDVSRATARTTSFIFAIFLGATCFSVVLRELGGDEVIESAITALPFGPTGIVICLMGLVFLLGFFLDWIEITLIVLPLMEPVTLSLGIDKLWFTMLVAVCLQTSFLTPPVGFALFYLKGVAPPGIELGHIYRGVVPFVLLQLIGLAALFVWPELVTWLPGVAF
ncbi:MAG: TRAP transporter large permease subunit [Deltaproteobacteria bacterium]|nr:TRAP transporter large permease subunit [Deltaproteobacteria bacterium]MBW2393540.1 TRAP transporter large permease subunit [Deltaproteobacteria bacterium]